MASVHRLEGGNYKAVWRQGAGETLQQRSKTFATKREAQAYARQQERAFERRGVAAAPELTFTQLVEEKYLPWGAGRLQRSTMASYQRNLRLLSRFIGDMRVATINPEHLDLAYARLLAGGGAGGRPLAARTVLHIHRNAHKAFGQAVKWRMLEDNPCRLATPPSVPRKRAVAPTMEQVSQLIAYAKNPPWPQLFALMVMTGLRRGEALGQRWRDLDLEAGWLTVNQVVEQAGPDYRLRELPKTFSSARRIGLDRAACDMLSAWKVQLAEMVLGLGLSWSPEALVFPDLRKGSVCSPREPDQVSSEASKIARRAGLPGGIAALHGLRHRHASALMGMPLRLVSDRLGHSTTRITVDLYQHSDDAGARSIADAAGVAFGPAVRLVKGKAGR
jgi:integrase